MQTASHTGSKPLRQSLGRPSVILSLILSTLLLASIPALAQLPAGAIDTTAPPKTAAQDPARAQANDALDKRDYPTALKILTPLADKNPTDAHLLYDLAFTQDALAETPAQTTAAEQTYRRAIAADPAYFDPHLALGLLLARGGRLTDAHNELQKAITLTTDNPALKGRAYRALARIDQSVNPPAASDELLSAIKITPETPGDILLSGELAEASGDSTAAELAYRRLLAVDPQNHDATAALTHLLLHQQQPEKAESLLTAALAKDPDNPTLNAQLASLYEQQGKTAQAIPLAAKLHAAHPEDSAITRLLARLYSRNQQYDQAAPLYNGLLTRSTQDPTLLDDSADVQIHLKNFAEAEALLKRALAQTSAFPTKDDLAQAASHLAFAASANNDPTTTLQALDIRGKVQPQSPSSLFLAATAHDKLHHTKQATDLYKQFLSVANGQFPDEEWEARHRLLTLDHMK
ncbi:tetratricopeptide repeat protein [Tunturiibacter empetritectus]|uniref:Tetratricopeptide (TPR) repeat protein n=2 Tax=Tunturiibacter TaxID=3154218 RepID=A0A852VJT1_9BACT|nr:tetratricopeptide repeat protein [Edaphobacter lichenicola]NYF89712.1 tetratricopeptide (TPR) repeat protein [Edaphobacter lichenicola]